MAANMDTHQEVKNLVDAGFTESKAEAVVETVVAGRTGLATKADLDLLRAALQADMKDLKLDLIKWLGGTTIAMVGIAVAVLSLILGS